MKILVIGSGGREHALCWKLSQSPKAEKIYCAPGNAGTEQYAENIDIQVDETKKIIEFAKDKEIGLVVVGPELPLTLGLVDKLEAVGIKAFGPSKAAAEIEGSKAFSKMIMEKYGIPTAKYDVFNEINSAKAYIKTIGVPCVIKADGLAAGKGVFICFTEKQANDALDDILEAASFGQAGSRVVIEEYLEGQEVSMLAFSDGKTVIPMVSAQDHKRIFDNDEGLNTGGMGAYSPAPMYSDEIAKEVNHKALNRVVEAMQKEGRKYKGVIYAGLMLTEKGVKVLEYNARFGDPETQVVLTRLDSDLVDIMLAVCDEKLDEIDIKWKKEAAVCVVMSSKGYPGNYRKNDLISFGEENAEMDKVSFVFHAGTKMEGPNVVTSGGRVLGVTAIGDTIRDAISNAYKRVETVSFDGAHYRKDIGKKAMDYDI